MKVNGRIQLYPILRVVIFFIIGIVLGTESFGLIPFAWWFAALLLSLGTAYVFDRHAITQTVLIFTACTCLGGCLTVRELDSVDISLPEDEVCFEAVVVSPTVITGKVVRCDMIITDRHKPIKIKASIFRDNRSEALKPGSGLRAKGTLRKPANFAGSTFDYSRYLLYHGYSATTFLYINDWHSDRISLRNLSSIDRTKIMALKLRDKLSRHFKASGISGQGYAVLAAMVLGERVSMSKAMTDDYSVSGALHVLSLSGLHLGIIYSMLLLLFFRRRQSVIVQVLIVCAVWTYVFIAGLPASAVRSAVMLTVNSLVCLLNRDNISLNVLSVAAWSVLIAHPLDFYDVGFQMSFVSVMFIILFYPIFYNVMPERLRGVPPVRIVWQMCSVSIAAQLGVAPLVAFYFSRFSCYFLLANFVAIPASSIILYGAATFFAFAWLPWFQDMLGTVLLKTVDIMNAYVSFIAALPGASINGIKINVVQLLMVYVIIFSVYFGLPYVRKMYWTHRRV